MSPISRPRQNLTSSLFGDAPEAPPPNDSALRGAPDLPKGLDPDDYEMDPDGHVRALVREWVHDKHARLERYVEISAAARRKWVKNGPGGTGYIDLFSGPGRCRIKGSDNVLPGSTLVAWRAALEKKSQFTEIFIGDLHPSIRAAAEFRSRPEIQHLQCLEGSAESTAAEVIKKANRHSLHLALLDPFNLGALPFSVIQTLAQLRHIDLLIHISLLDLNRNLLKYIKDPVSPLDAFAPRWREVVDQNRPVEYVRAKIFEHWRGLLGTLDMRTSEAAELVSGPNGQPLYWLAFTSRHARALEFWEKIRTIKPNPQAGILEPHS